MDGDWNALNRTAQLLGSSPTAASRAAQDAWRYAQRAPASSDTDAIAMLARLIRSVRRHHRATLRHGAQQLIFMRTDPYQMLDAQRPLTMLHQLSRREREVLVLRSWLDQSLEEVSFILNISVDAVGDVHERAMRLIDNWVGPDGETVNTDDPQDVRRALDQIPTAD
jgi:DNA-directed RNA polymerase specialized sigma24 family protein